MPRIKRQLKVGDGPNPPISAAPTQTHNGVSSPLTREWANCTPAEEVGGVLFLEFYMDRVDWVRHEVWSVKEDGGAAIAFGLDELLPNGLWLRLISHSLLGYFECDDQECLDLFDNAEWVTFSWEETYEEADGEGPWITVYAEGDFVGYERFDDFFEGWDGESLRWLIPELGITPAKLRSTLKRLMPAE